MQIRALKYFVAIAREEHFARAADACSVTQPTLSAGIAALEEQLGKRLVHRDRRYIGLTDEGRAALPWAQQALAMLKGLEHATAAEHGPLRGTLRLGVIPAAMPAVGHFAHALGKTHPHVSLRIRSLTSREIERDLEAFELDAGLTYLDHEPPGHVLSVPLYDEHTVFVGNVGLVEARPSISWDDALSRPLCLLHEGMQNRRILDANLAERNLSIQPAAIANSYAALLSLVEIAGFATMVPDRYAAQITQSWARILPFEEPLRASRVGLIVHNRAPLGTLSQAALTATNRVNFGLAASSPCEATCSTAMY